MKIFILFTIAFACCFLGNVVSNANPLPYDAIFNFGDSISDTGNMGIRSNHSLDKAYGSTYFKYPAGRMSDGRLIIDFIAEGYGLPFLPPYLSLTEDQDIKKGVNFAVGGAGAIDDDYYVKNNIPYKPTTNASLNVQLGWFKNLKPSLCKSKEDCDGLFKKSLFLVGEIGGNDVVSYLMSKKTIAEIREIVPLIVEAITKTTTALIEEGAVELVIPGNFPMGCNAAVMGLVKSANHDQLGCLADINSLVEYFNEQLKSSIETLRKKHPQAKITYFDYYNNTKRFFQSPEEYVLSIHGHNPNYINDAGFDKNVTFEICLAQKGVCSDISKHIIWDYMGHLTEAAYKLIAKGLLEGPFADPSLKSPPNKIA